MEKKDIEKVTKQIIENKKKKSLGDFSYDYSRIAFTKDQRAILDALGYVTEPSELSLLFSTKFMNFFEGNNSQILLKEAVKKAYEMKMPVRFECAPYLSTTHSLIPSLEGDIWFDDECSTVSIKASCQSTKDPSEDDRFEAFAIYTKDGREAIGTELFLAGTENNDSEFLDSEDSHWLSYGPRVADSVARIYAEMKDILDKEKESSKVSDATLSQRRLSKTRNSCKFAN